MDAHRMYSDIERVKVSEDHEELIAGELVIENRTSMEHNDAVVDILTEIKNYIKRNNGKCRVFSENVALYVNELISDDGEFYLPDIMLVCDPDGVQSDGVHVVPDFVAEVTSDSTKVNDYGHKREVYQKIGVSEYWIVDIQKKIITKYLSAEEYIPQPYLHPEVMKLSVYPDCYVDVSAIMK